MNGAIIVLGATTLSVAPNSGYDLQLDAVGNELALSATANKYRR